MRVISGRVKFLMADQNEAAGAADAARSRPPVFLVDVVSR
jgi:hypothetical protein